MLAAFLTLAHAEPIVGFVDLHMHIAAHLTVPVYGSGPERDPPASQSYLHALEPQIFVRQLAEPGPAIIVSLAYANPFATVFESRTSMRRRIERQLDFVEEFCARNKDEFGWAKTPEEARTIVQSGRKAIVHGIEGATKILGDASDAAYWASRGVAVITPVHLSDNEIGGAWCQEGQLGVLNVPGCRRERISPETHGLTPDGHARITDLIDAGIIVDLAHTSDASFAEIVPILRDRAVAPVYTHATSFSVTVDPTAISDDQLREIESLGGLVGVTGNLSHLPPNPIPGGLPGDYCRGSINDFRLHWDRIVSVAGGEPVAWGSDFQGGVDHIRPKYGPLGCAPSPRGRAPEPFDLLGLAHPGLVEPMFSRLAAMGSSRAPLDSSAERFLEIWARAQGKL